MDLTLFYQVGASFTAGAAIYFLKNQLEGTPADKLTLGVILTIGLLMWPGLLFGIIHFNNALLDPDYQSS